jgi:hypothetical protein
MPSHCVGLLSHETKIVNPSSFLALNEKKTFWVMFLNSLHCEKGSIRVCIDINRYRSTKTSMKRKKSVLCKAITKKAKKEVGNQCKVRGALTQVLQTLDILLDPLYAIVGDYLYDNMFAKQSYQVVLDIQYVFKHNGLNKISGIVTGNHMMLGFFENEDRNLFVDFMSKTNLEDLPLSTMLLPSQTAKIYPVYNNHPADYVVLQSNPKTLNVHAIATNEKTIQKQPLLTMKPTHVDRCFLVHNQKLFTFNRYKPISAIQPCVGHRAQISSPDKEKWSECPNNEVISIPQGQLQFGYSVYNVKRNKLLILTHLTQKRSGYRSWFIHRDWYLKCETLIPTKTLSRTLCPVGNDCDCNQCESKPLTNTDSFGDLITHEWLWVPEHKKIILFTGDTLQVYHLESAKTFVTTGSNTTGFITRNDDTANQET